MTTRTAMEFQVNRMEREVAMLESQIKAALASIVGDMTRTKDGAEEGRFHASAFTSSSLRDVPVWMEKRELLVQLLRETKEALAFDAKA